MTVLNDTMQKELSERRAATQARLDGLRQRIAIVEARIAKEKAEILELIDERGRELTRLLNAFQAEFEEDRTQRLVREEAIVKRLTDHEHYSAEAAEKQVEARERQYLQLRGMLEANVKLREKAESRFQAAFENEVSKLQNNLRVETEVSPATYFDVYVFPLPLLVFFLLSCFILSFFIFHFSFFIHFHFHSFSFFIFALQVRAREDDEIVEALNRYTLKLQASLRVVNSTDM